MSVLDKIVASKLREIEAAKAAQPEALVRAAASAAPSPRNFFAALAAPGPIKLIAEVKKASPSAGVIRADFDPVEIAEIYEQHGATCLSVLTDEPFFQGRLEYLRDIRATVQLPVLRKDFILDKYQVYEARAVGADAVLLIAECLDDCNLRALHNEIMSLGMTPLVELYEPANLPRRSMPAPRSSASTTAICTPSKPISITHCGCAKRFPTTACWSPKAASAPGPMSSGFSPPA